MKSQIIIFILIIAFMSSIITTIHSSPSRIFFEANTDKENYTQGELMKLSFNINTETARQVTIEIHGIKKTNGNYLKNLRDVVNLTKGSNILEYTEIIPHCSSCSGVSKGENEVTFIVTDSGETLLNETKRIVIM